MNKKAAAVRTNYVTRARHLDEAHAPEVNSPGPFVQAMTTFHGGGVTPFCFGAFGEANDGVDAYVQRCAKLAACRREGLESSPIGNSDSPLGAYNILVRRFRTALAVLVSTENAFLKVKRLQFVRATKEEAASAASEQVRGSAGYFK